MASFLAPWWPKFILEAVEARGYSSVPNQCQDWEKFQRQKLVSPKTGDLPLTLPLIWQWREVSIKSETKTEANFQFIFCLWFGTYLELITLSAKSVANSETNFQSWDWTFIASEIHASLGTDLPLIALWEANFLAWKCISCLNSKSNTVGEALKGLKITNLLNESLFSWHFLGILP